MLTRVILFMYYQSWGQLTQVIFDVTWSLHKLIWLKYPVWNWKKPVWNVKRLINLEFDYVRLPHPIQINPTIRVQFKMISRTHYTVSVLLPMFINKMADSVECESMLFITNHISYLWGLLNSFSISSIDFYGWVVVWPSAIRKNET